MHCSTGGVGASDSQWVGKTLLCSVGTTSGQSSQQKHKRGLPENVEERSLPNLTAADEQQAWGKGQNCRRSLLGALEDKQGAMEEDLSWKPGSAVGFF